jgi:predicted transcriptional regulator
MRTTTCEYILWNLLPTIRYEIAWNMVNIFGLTQRETAAKLEITPAAVCMYLSGKRGKCHINNKNILKELQVSAENIIKNEKNDLVKETCRVCKIVRDNGLIPISNSKTNSQ